MLKTKSVFPQKSLYTNYWFDIYIIHSLKLFFVVIIILLCYQKVFSNEIPDLQLINNYIASDTTVKLLSLKNCLRFALEVHPLLKQSEEILKITHNKKGLIKANINDKLSINTNFQRRKNEFIKNQPKNLITDDIIDSTIDSISYKKVIYDFGKTKTRLKSIDFDLISSKNDLLWNKTQICAEVKSAWLRVRKNRALLEVHKNNLERFQIHLEKVKNYVNVGFKSPYDITKAELDVANARFNLISAESNYKLSIVNLQKALGISNQIELPDSYKLIESLDDFTENATFSIITEHLNNAILYKEAIENRPDIRSAKMALKSAEIKLQEAKLGKKPTLTTSADYNFSGSTTPLDRNYIITLSLNIPLLDGKLTHYSINEAISNYNIAKHKLDNLVVNVRAELDSTILSLKELQEKLQATKVLVLQASETMYLAENRYSSGLGSAIELTDARNAFTNALGSFYTTYYDKLILLTNLEKILGRLPQELEN